MRAIILGRSGQLARCLAESVPTDTEANFLGRETLDLAQPDFAFDCLEDRRPDLVINAAAYTAVDQAESEPEAAFALNCEAPRRLAAFCRDSGVPLIHISTDYVFDGTAPRPYREDDPTAPLNVYGRSKLAGEQAIVDILAEHLIVRTSWVYSAYGQNFVKTMLRLRGERDELRIVSDQHGKPTSAHSLARILWTLAGQLRDGPQRTPWGLFHYADHDVTNWADFAELIFRKTTVPARADPVITPIPTHDYPTPAPRPLNSVLDCAKIRERFGVIPPPLTQSLDEVLGLLQREAVQ